MHYLLNSIAEERLSCLYTNISMVLAVSLYKMVSEEL